jgi:hypothetical protein
VPGAVPWEGSASTASTSSSSIHGWGCSAPVWRRAAPFTVMDRCRIRWGRVGVASGEVATVRNRTLAFEGSRLVLGPEQVGVVHRSRGGVGLAPEVALGGFVSLHWDWVCDLLSPATLAKLRRCTATDLAAVNALPTLRPAVI